MSAHAAPSRIATAADQPAAASPFSPGRRARVLARLHHVGLDRALARGGGVRLAAALSEARAALAA